MRRPQYSIDVGASKATINRLAKLAGVDVRWSQYRSTPKTSWYEFTLNGDDWEASKKVNATLARLIREAKP